MPAARSREQSASLRRPGQLSIGQGSFGVQIPKRIENQKRLKAQKNPLDDSVPFDLSRPKRDFPSSISVEREGGEQLDRRRLSGLYGFRLGRPFPRVFGFFGSGYTRSECKFAQTTDRKSVV